MIILLTIFGLVLRLCLIGQGLPDVYYSDERRYTYYALNMGGGDINPHDFFHPSLYYYLCFFADIVFVWVKLAAGTLKAPSEAWQLFRQDPSVFFLIGRIVSAVLGAVTIPVTYLMGKKSFDKTIGILGAFFVTLSFLHFQWSQIGYTDSAGAFFIALAFLFSLLALEKGRIQNFILAGFVSGLAASTRYPGFETFLWGPLALVLLALQEKKNPLSELIGKRSLAFALFFVLGFTAATPYWILDFPKFKTDFLWNWLYYKHAGKGQLGYEGEWSWVYYLTTPLSFGLGIPLAIAALLGMLLLIFRMNKERLFFLSFPLVYFLIAGASQIRTARYLLPLIPFFCIAAALFLNRAVAKVVRPEGKGFRWALALLAFLVILPSFLSILRFCYLRSFPDTRTLAFAWIRERLPRDAQLLHTSYLEFQNPPAGGRTERLDATLFNTRVDNISSLRTLEEVRKEGFEYVVLDGWHTGILLAEGREDPRYQETIERYQKFLADLNQTAKLLVSFSPARDQEIEFDMENVETPSRSLWKLKSPGPPLRIYRL